MSKIGVLGGSFDPVHNGHIALANAALSELQLNKLILMPAGIQPFKLDRKPASAEDRVEMLKLAFSYEPKIEVSTYEIDKNDISYTYNTLIHLEEEYEGSNIIFIMGADSMLTLDRWYKGEELLRSFSFAVSSRPGYENDELHKSISKYRNLYCADITILLSTMLYLSATEVRNAISTGNDAEKLLDPSVFEYIKEHNLYV